ncbi:MAG: hypothetical protein AB1449_10835 [Chloroflexota bacterium]
MLSDRNSSKGILTWERRLTVQRFNLMPDSALRDQTNDKTSKPAQV